MKSIVIRASEELNRRYKALRAKDYSHEAIYRAGLDILEREKLECPPKPDIQRIVEMESNAPVPETTVPVVPHVEEKADPDVQRRQLAAAAYMRSLGVADDTALLFLTNYKVDYLERKIALTMRRIKNGEIESPKLFIIAAIQKDFSDVEADNENAKAALEKLRAMKKNKALAGIRARLYSGQYISQDEYAVLDEKEKEELNYIVISGLWNYYSPSHRVGSNIKKEAEK